MPSRANRGVYDNTLRELYRAEDDPDLPAVEDSVYFVHAAGHAIKIGLSRNVQVRLMELQTGSPVKLELLGTVSGDRKTEAMLHKRLEKYRLHGEWFSEEILPLVLKILAEPGIVESASRSQAYDPQAA